MASISDILRTIQGAIDAGITSAGIQTPGQVIVGWPTGSEAAKIWGNGGYIVSLYALKTEPHTRYRPSPAAIAPITPPTLTATLTQSAGFTTIALSGVNAAGYNLTTVVGPSESAQSYLYQTTGSETFAQLASFVAAGISGNSFVTASATGASIHITGGYPVWFTIGQTTTLYQEVARFRRLVQVTIWAPYPDAVNAPSDGTRENIEVAVLNSLGGTDQAWNSAPDGSTFSALWRSTGDWSDKAESSYTVFRSDNFLEIAYGQLKTTPGTTIGAITLTTANESQSGFTKTSTIAIGGP